MKRKPFLIMLPLAVMLLFSCHKEAKFSDNPSATNALLSGKATTIEALCNEYFKAHQTEAASAAKIIAVTNEFFAINQKTKEFRNKKPSHIQPIYAYGIDGIAYYEIWFTEDNKTPKGWILISATDKDYPLVNFSQGVPYSSHLLNESNQNNKIYRFGVSYYAMEKNGQKIADYGKMPSFIANADSKLEGSGSGDSKNPNKTDKKGTAEPREGIDYTVITNYESLKKLYAKNYYSAKRSVAAQDMQRRIFPVNGHGEAVKNGAANARDGEYYYFYVPGYSAYYTQIAPNYRYNYFSCWSGCSNNAWANIYGWWDANMGKSSLIPTTSTGEASPLYRNTYERQDVIDPIQMYIRALSGTYCSDDGSGSTNVSDVYKGVFYAPNAGYGYYYHYQWCSNGGCDVNLANIAIEGIVNSYEPVHIGANSHAYVGLGLAQWSDNTDWTWTYCYPGWQENNDDNVWIWWRDFVTSTRLDVY